jgi:hypothetical protein
MLNFVKGSSASIEVIISFLSLILFMCYISFIDLIWFAYIEPSFLPWNETNLIMVYDPFNVLMDSVCKYFLVNFLSILSRKLVCNFLFVLCLYLVFVLG